MSSRIAWYRSPLAPEKLEALTKRSNARGALFLASHLALLAATGSLACWLALHEHFLGFVLMLPLHGACYSFLGYAGLGHELAHRTVFDSRATNDTTLAVVSFLTWNNHHYFRKSHTLHHQFTVHDGIDGEVKLPQIPIIRQWPHLVFFDAPFFWRALTITFDNARNLVKGTFGQRLFQEGGAERARLVAWARTVLFGHFALALLFIGIGLWPLLFLVTLAPFFGTLPNRLLAQAQHYGLKPNTTDFRECARTVVLHPFVAFLYWQMNYHLEHHMYPAVPFFRLRDLQGELRADVPPPMRGIWAVVRLMRSE
jgi:fatty acid desaturase